MYKFLLYLILLPTSIAFASSDHLHSHDKHKDINIAYKEVNQDKYNVFVEDLEGNKQKGIITSLPFPK